MDDAFRRIGRGWKTGGRQKINKYVIVIINGSLGVGKSTVSEALLEKLSPAVLLEGDALGDVQPFQMYDAERIAYLYRTISHLLAFHVQNGYQNIIINYVFESEASLRALVTQVESHQVPVYCFYLTCEATIQAQRIRRRNNNQVDWELQRYPVLNRIQAAARKKDFLGWEVPTSHRTAEAVAEDLYQRMLTEER